MSKTAVSTSGDVKTKVASHLSKVPLIATDASTSNLIELSTGVISNTGACARPSDGNTLHTRRQKIGSIPLVLSLCHFIVNSSHLKLSPAMPIYRLLYINDIIFQPKPRHCLERLSLHSALQWSTLRAEARASCRAWPGGPESIGCREFI